MFKPHNSIPKAVGLVIIPCAFTNRGRCVLGRIEDDMFNIFVEHNRDNIPVWRTSGLVPQLNDEQALDQRAIACDHAGATGKRR